MNALSPYQGYFSHWSRLAGRRPSHKEIRAVHLNGLARVGSKNAVALAMALRDCGTTQGQIQAVLGVSCRNKIKDVVLRGQAIKVAMPKLNGTTVYRIKVSH